MACLHLVENGTGPVVKKRRLGGLQPSQPVNIFGKTCPGVVRIAAVAEHLRQKNGGATCP